jgi:acyl-CoA reductase-like NAD-dependent aldehyde dehydrogenase
MTIPQLMPWIGGPVKFDAGLSPLVCPIDESVASHMIESDAKVVDAAVRHAHTAFLTHQAATTAKRVEWLLAAADAMDRIEGELVRSLIRFIGKPRRAATFEAKRVGTFMRACAAQLPHLMGEVLPLDAAAAGAGRFGFTTRVPYGVVAAVTPFNGPANLLIQKVAPALAVGNAIVVKPSPPGTEVALLMAQAIKTAGIPDGLFNVVPGGRETAELLAAHPLVAVVSVTGSTAAGNALARAAGAKKFVGELGSNASKAAPAMRVAASSRSASAQTIFAALEPSSPTNFFAPAARANALPAAVLPVTLTTATSGWAASSSAVSRPPGTTLKSPSGMPAVLIACAISSATSVPGGDGLTTIALPTASAGATF